MLGDTSIYILEKNEEKEISTYEFEEKFGVIFSNKITLNGLTDPEIIDLHKNIICPQVNKISDKSLSNKYFLLKYSPKVGWGAVARENINEEKSKDFYIGVYSGILETKTLKHSSDYSMSLSNTKISLQVNSEKQGNLLRFLQDAPKSLEEVKSEISIPDNSPLKFNSIAIANSRCVEENSVPFIVTNETIKKGEALFFSYGKNYWFTTNNAGKLFYKNGDLIPMLYYRRNILNIYIPEEFLNTHKHTEINIPQSKILQTISTPFKLNKLGYHSIFQNSPICLSSLLLAKLAVAQNVCFPCVDFEISTNNKNKTEKTFNIISEKKGDYAQQFRIAAAKGDLTTIRDLLESGKVTNIDDVALPTNDLPKPSGQTALFNAVKQGHKDIVKYLIIHNASPFIANKDGDTPYSIATKEIREYILDPSIYIYKTNEKNEINKIDNAFLLPGKGYEEWLKNEKEARCIINSKN